MKAHSANSFLVMWLLFTLLSAVAACGDAASGWTSETKENIQHFFASQKADLEAVRLSNSGAPYSIMSGAERDEFVRLSRVALSEAMLLRDEVLAMANRDLPIQFRTLYQQSLELRLRNLEAGDMAAERESSSLHDQWVEWFNTHRSTVKIPK